MTNIEEQFYKTFEIKPRQMYIFTKDYEATITSGITDRILLELIRLITNKGISVYSENLDDFKNNILKFYISQKKHYSKKQVQQVQALFKGE